MKKIFLFSIFIFCSGVFQIGISTAQTTGVWTKSITWGSGTRREVFNVPTNYNPSKKYKLIVALHGMNGDPTLYVKWFQFMCNQPTSTYPYECGAQFYYPTIPSPVYGNFIIACPDAPGGYGDFWEPVGDTALITHIIKDAQSMYNIDPEYIYLNGESLGGRAALAYGLINYWRFRGLILWVPAVQSMSEAQGGTWAQAGNIKNQYQYAKNIPISYEVAATDGLLYYDVQAFKKLYWNGGILENQTLYPFCHSPSPDNFTFHAIDFIDKNATSYKTNDAGIFEITSPLTQIAGGTFTPKIKIQNKGIGTLTSATVNYQIDNGTVNTVSWTGSLKQLERATITLPAQTVTGGAHTFKVYTSQPNGAADNVPANDQQTINFNFISNGSVTNLSENFEGQTQKASGIFITDWRGPAGWRQAGTDSAFFWQLDTAEGSKGSKTCINFFNSSQSPNLPAPDNAGKKSSLISPAYDFTNATSPVLTYDIAYAPMKSGSTILADSLTIKYSTDCGNTWTTLYKNGGVAMNTRATTVWGDISNGDFFLSPTSSEWKTQTVNLSALAGKSNVEIAFENTCGKGNILYLDNFSITGATAVTDPQQLAASFDIYPNPSNGIFTIRSRELLSTNYLIGITNILGDQVWQSITSGSGSEIDISAQPNGVYLMSIQTELGTFTKKLVIEK